jgi:hypothetical protein
LLERQGVLKCRKRNLSFRAGLAAESEGKHYTLTQSPQLIANQGDRLAELIAVLNFVGFGYTFQSSKFYSSG